VRDALDEQPAHVLVLATLGAPQRRLLGARRPREAPPEPPPVPVATARATVIDAAPVALEEAERWLAGLADAGETAAALAVVGRAVRGYRIASGDPAVHEPSLAQALVVRAGQGSGEQVAYGRWTAARELPPPRPRRERRSIALQPHERLAALLGARSTTLACEELALRARHDLDAGQLREAALQLRAALDAALVELAAAPGEPNAAGNALAARVDELRERRPLLDALANAALGTGLAPHDTQSLADVLSRLEAALRARAAAGG
jgi:hypothetical protein